MKTIILGLLLLGAGGVAVGQTVAPKPAVAVPAAAPTLADLKKQFETAMRDAQKANREALKNLRQLYSDNLAKLQAELQAKGEMQVVLTIRDEKARFEQAGDIPPAALVTEPAALRKAQDDWNASCQQAPVAQAQKLVGLSEKYMQQLAQLQKSLTAKNDQEGLKAVNEETDRLLGNNVIREALALVKAAKPATPEKVATPAPVKPEPAKTEATTPVKAEPAKLVEVGAYKFYPTGKEPAAKDLRDQRLEYPTAERRNSAYFYMLSAKVYFDKAKMSGDKHNYTYYSTKIEAGDLVTFPRVTLASRNKEIPEGGKLVIQYFSRHITKLTDVREERVEHITLPLIARGQSLTVDGQGISLSKSDRHDSDGYRVRSGREYYGIVLTVADADDKIIIQQCSPSSLIKSCSTTIPPAKEQGAGTSAPNRARN
jgi:hypothetical protein